MKLIVLGATGLVGGRLLEAALNDERVSYVLAPFARQFLLIQNFLLP